MSSLEEFRKKTLLESTGDKKVKPKSSLEEYKSGYVAPKPQPVAKKTTSLRDTYTPELYPGATPKKPKQSVVQKGQSLSAPKGNERAPLTERVKDFTEKLFNLNNKSQVSQTIERQQKSFESLVKKAGVLDSQTEEGYTSPFSSVQKAREIQKSNVPTVGGIVEGITDVSGSDIPFAGSLAFDAPELAKAVYLNSKIQKGIDISEEDAVFLNDFLVKEEEATRRRKSDAGYRIGEGLRNSLTFMAELGTASLFAPETGGGSIASLFAKKTATEGVKNAVRKMVGDKVVRDAVAKELKNYGVKGAVLLGSQAVTHVPEDALQRMVGTKTFSNDLGEIKASLANDGQKIGEAALNAFTSSLVETGSEYSGGIFSMLGKGLKDQLIKASIIKATLAKNPSLPPTVIETFFKKAGWNGVLGEMGEEQIGNLAYGILNQAGLSDRDFALPSKEELAEQFLSFALMGTAIKAIGSSYRGVIKKDLPASFSTETKEVMDSLSNFVETSLAEGDDPVEVTKALIDSGVDMSTAMSLVTSGEFDYGEGAQASIFEDVDKDIDSWLQTEEKTVLEDTTKKIEKVKAEKPKDSETFSPVDFNKLDIPEDKQKEAETDWEDNFAENYQDIYSEVQDLEKQLKNAKGEVKRALTARISTANERLAEIEDAFVEKYNPEQAQTTKELTGEKTVIKKEGLEIKVKQNEEGKWISQYNASNGEIGTRQNFQKFSQTFDTEEEAIQYAKDQIKDTFEGNLAISYKNEKGEPMVDETNAILQEVGGKLHVKEEKASKTPKKEAKTEKPKFPVLAKGTKVSFEENGKTLTGVIRSTVGPDDSASVDVDQISTVGGVPIGRIVVFSNPSGLKVLDTVDDKEDNVSNEQGDQQKGLPDTSDIPAEDDLGGGGEATSEVSGYDRGAMLAESGNGLIATGADGLGKKGRQLINEQVEALLEERKYSIVPEDYSENELALMRAYSGAGGKESVGGEGAGLLNEYYTPQAVIEKLWDIAGRLAPNAETAFEPSAGTGRIISSSPAHIKMDGAEISKVSGTIAQVLNRDSKITIGDFQELFFDRKTNKTKVPQQYDLLVGNPPFGARAGFLKGKGEEKDINRQEEYFIKRGLDMTKEGGYLVYVVNSSFLKTGMSKGKEAIANIGYLEAAYRLPENSFEDTSIGTDIVVFRKVANDGFGGPRSTSLRDDMYFRGKPQHILGAHMLRKNRFGQTEGYVKGDLESSMKLLDTLLPEPAKTIDMVEAPVVDRKTPKVTESKQVSTKKSPKTAKKVEKDSQATMPKANASELIRETENISNKKNASPVEIQMLKRVARDLSVPTPSQEETQYLNLEEGKYYPDAIYFSGNVAEKLEKLEKNKKTIIENLGEAQYEKQKKGLESILPEAVKIKDIVFDPMDRHITGIEAVDRRGEKTNVLGLFKGYLRNNQVALSPRVAKYDVIRYVNGDQASKGTKPIMGSIKEDAKRLFNAYLQNEAPQEIQKEIEGKYNKEKNAYVLPDYTQLPIEVQEMAKQFRGKDFSLSETQKNGVSFLVNKGSGLIAYGVGVGKTHTLAVATKANMDKGWTKRPLFTVPKSLLTVQKGYVGTTIDKTWIGTMHEMFPTLKINNLEGLQAPIVARLKRERGEDPKNWIQDGEFTVISHEGLLRLGLKEEELRAAVGDLKDAIWKNEATKRGEEKTKEKYDEILGNAQKYVTDVMFSDLGFDHISVDEVHNFRKIFQGAKPENVDENGKQIGQRRFGNVIGGTPSKRAQQLFLLTQYVQKNNNNRNVFLASATPFENQATEVYNILSLVARDRMKEMGIFNINDFFASFANFEVELDYDLKGNPINREKMKSFSNLPALQSLLKEFIDRQEDPTLVRPERRVITPHLQMSSMQIENLTKIQELLSGVKSEIDDTEAFNEDSKTMYNVVEKDAEDGAFLKASTYSIANSVSPYFIKEYVQGNPTAKEIVAESPKIQYALETVKKVKNDPKTAGFGTFIFFGKMGVEYHPMLAKYFAKEAGYKSDEVAYISGNVTDEEKEVIKEGFNSGKIKVLLGGDQTKEGIDLQNNGFITINLALGWNPTQIQQVEGRVWRQGNRRNIAPLIYPLVENSGDAVIYSKFEEKGSRINDLFSYSGKVFDIGEVDPAEKKLSLVTDPKLKAKMQIEIDKKDLSNERVLIDTEINGLNKMRSDIERAKGDIEFYEEELPHPELREDRKKEYQKELKNTKDRLARIEKKLEEKKIPDLNAKIGDMEASLIDLDSKIKEMDKEYDRLFQRFSDEYKEQVKKRKTMAQHMEQVQTLIDEVEERTPEEIDAIKAKLVAELEETKKASIPEFELVQVPYGQKLTLKTLEKLKGRTTVSKQFISDLTNSGEIKQIEREIIRDALMISRNTVNVADFTELVESALLPLEVKNVEMGLGDFNEEGGYAKGRYESISLPSKLRGNVEDYKENIYESPITTSAGNVHFEYDTDNYFGHTRIEDMADDETRRVIEVQSDLYQKGNLERELKNKYNSLSEAEKDIYYKRPNLSEAEVKKQAKILFDFQGGSVNKLQQYNDPTAHFRMVREEIKKAAEDGKTKLQFPTGETAMKIEGLGNEVLFAIETSTNTRLTPGRIEPGLRIVESRNVNGQEELGTKWTITDVLENGKFKAMKTSNVRTAPAKEARLIEQGRWSEIPDFMKETFDISGKVDTENPIYKFYEKEVARYLKNKYDAKQVTDAQGVTWNEVDVKPEMATSPVEAFQKEGGFTNEATINFEEAKRRVEAYKKRLKLDFDVDFADAIFTPKGEEAYGVSYNGKIYFTDKVLRTTPDHELLHKIVANIHKIKAFEGITASQLFKAQNGGREVDYTDSDLMLKLNEGLANGYQAKMRGENQSNVPNIIRRFYDKFQILMNKLRKALGVDIDIIDDFYRKVASAEAKKGEEVKFESRGFLDRQVKYEEEGDIILDFRRQGKEMDDVRRARFETIEKELGINISSFSLKKKDLNWFNKYLASSRELYISDEQTFSQAKKFDKTNDRRLMQKALLDKKAGEQLKPYFTLEAGQMKEVNKLLVKGDTERREFNNEEMDSVGFSSPQKEAYLAVRKAFNEAHVFLLAEMEKNGATKEQLEEWKRELKGYIPHKWPYKNAVKKYKLSQKGFVEFETEANFIKEANAKGSDFFEGALEKGFLEISQMDTYKTLKEAKEKASTSLKNGEIALVTELTSLSVDFFSEQRFSIGNMRTVIAQAKVAQDVKDKILDGLSNLVKEKGFGRQYIHRGGVSGYEKEELAPVIANYFAGMNGFLTKMEAGKKYFEILSEVQERRQPSFYAWLRDTIAFDMGNSVDAIQIPLGGERKLDLREVAFITHLAQDMSYLIINATQNLTIGTGELSKLVTGNISKAYVPEKELMKAVTDYAFGRLSEDEKFAVDSALEVGRLGGEMTAELMNFKNNPLYRTISSTIRKALYNSTALVEQRINRVPAFLAARRLLQAQGITDVKELNEKALFISDTIHVRSKKANLPVLFRGPIGGTVFIFQNFTRVMMYGMYHDLSKGEFMSFSKKMFYTALLGGTVSLPGAKLILALIKWLIPDPDEEEQEEISKMELALTRGVPAAYANIDLSSRVSFDVMTITSLFEGETPKGTWEKIWDMRTWAGASGGVITRIKDGIDLATQGRILEAMGKLPDFVGNPLKAYQGMTNGIYTKAGNPLLDKEGELFMYTSFEAFVKATGFTPTRESLAWEESGKKWITKQLESEASSSVQAKIKASLRAGDIAKAQKIQAEAFKEGVLTDRSKDYVQEAVREKTIENHVKMWQEGAKSRSILDKMERDMAKEVFGEEYTKAQLTVITKDFAFYREFGFDDKLANSIKESKTASDKADLLITARKEMGLEEFKKFYEKGRKTVVYEPAKNGARNTGYVLISDAVKEAYLLKSK